MVKSKSAPSSKSVSPAVAKAVAATVAPPVNVEKPKVVKQFTMADYEREYRVALQNDETISEMASRTGMSVGNIRMQIDGLRKSVADAWTTKASADATFLKALKAKGLTAEQFGHSKAENLMPRLKHSETRNTVKAQLRNSLASGELSLDDIG